MAASEQEQIILIVKEALFNPGTAVPRICLDEAREAWQARAVPELLSQAGFSIIRTAELERLQRPGKTRIGALRGANEDRTRTAADRDVRLASKVLDALGNRCAAPQRRVAEARIRNPGASWAQLAAGLSMTKDQAYGHWRRMLAATGKPASKTGGKDSGDDE